MGEEGVSSVGGCGSLLTARLSRHSASACGEPLRPLGDIAMINAYDNQLIPMYVFPSTGHSLAKPAHIPVNTANQECVTIRSIYFSKFIANSCIAISGVFIKYRKVEESKQVVSSF